MGVCVAVGSSNELVEASASPRCSTPAMLILSGVRAGAGPCMMPSLLRGGGLPAAPASGALGKRLGAAQPPEHSWDPEAAAALPMPAGSTELSLAAPLSLLDTSSGLGGRLPLLLLLRRPPVPLVMLLLLPGPGLLSGSGCSLSGSGCLLMKGLLPPLGSEPSCCCSASCRVWRSGLAMRTRRPPPVRVPAGIPAIKSAWPLAAPAAAAAAAGGA
jgi:hypothetical protein